MAKRAPVGSLDRFEAGTFEHGGKTRQVFRRGTGPAVLVIAEMPGITPRVLGFAERVADLGCTAVLPHLFGDPGRDPVAGGKAASIRYLVSSVVPTCVSREFVTLATGRTSPVVEWLRALARHEHGRCGGPGVGAVGMCFTGGYALALSTIPEVVAPVLAQPSLPAPFGARRKAAIDISPEDMAVVEERCAAGLRVVGLRFEGDRLVPAARFAALQERLGAAFVAVDLPDGSAHPDAIGPPHSTLTEHVVDEPGERTHDALELVLRHFADHLLTPPATGDPAGDPGDGTEPAAGTGVEAAVDGE